MVGALTARRYALLSALTGGLLGVLLAIMSYYDMLSFLSPVARGVLGVIASALLAVLVAPAGFAREPPPSKGKILEAILASILSTLTVWPAVYTALGAG